MGRLEVNTNRVLKNNRTIFNSRTELFPKTAPKGRLCSACFEQTLLQAATLINSYRGCADILNRNRWQDDQASIKHRTLADMVERAGRGIIDYIGNKSAEILSENNFDCSTGTPNDPDKLDMAIVNVAPPCIDENIIYAAVDEYNEGKDRNHKIDETQIHESFVADENCINISIDDVNVVQQKETGRTKFSQPKEGRHYVKNTVVHIQHKLAKYILVGTGINNMLLVMLSFLLHNDLLKSKSLIFFTDGALDLRNGIKEVFSWRPYRIILDWYHLKKKCQERLSMALKGRVIRTEVLRETLVFLWVGKVDEAIEYLKGLNENKIKNKDEINRLIAYFEKNWSYIPCYALRKKLGLRISSNCGEKSNDLVVAGRQKHNGMSWSKSGSSALANVAALYLNNESDAWVGNKKLVFELQPMKKAV